MIDFILLSTFNDSWLFSLIGWLITTVSMSIAFLIALKLKEGVGIIKKMSLILLAFVLPLFLFGISDAESAEDCVIWHILMVFCFMPILWIYFQSGMMAPDKPQNTKGEESQNPDSPLSHQGKGVSKKSSKATRRHKDNS